MCECLSHEQHVIEIVPVGHWAGAVGMVPVHARGTWGGVLSPSGGVGSSAL